MNMKKFFAVLMLLCLLVGAAPVQALAGETYYISWFVNDEYIYGENIYVSFSHELQAECGAKVSVTPKTGYKVTSLLYFLPDDMNALQGQQQNGVWSFTMPEASVDVMVTVEADSGAGSNPPPAQPPAQPRATVRFDPNGGSCATQSAEVNAQNKLDSLPAATLSDHFFVGWFLNSGEQVTLNTEFTEDTTVYARWVFARHITDPADNAYSADIELDDQVVLQRLLTADDYARNENIYVWLDVEKMEQTAVPVGERSAIEASAGEDTVVAYMDVSLYKKFGDNGAQTKIHNTNGKIPITMKLTDDVIPENAERNSFCVIYYHDGAAHMISAVYVPATKTLIFEADAFSTYSLVYKTHVPQPAVPTTGDGSAPVLWSMLAVMSLLGMAEIVRRRSRA